MEYVFAISLIALSVIGCITLIKSIYKLGSRLGLYIKEKIKKRKERK